MFHVILFHVKHFYLQIFIFVLLYKKGGDDMVQDVITAINAVGLPTVVAVASMWYVKYREDKNDSRIDKLNEAHKKEMTDITEALNNNTLALQRICDTFEQKRED